MHTSFYASQSLYSDPGPYRETLMRAGEQPKTIARWINSWMQHPRGPESRQRGFQPEQVADLELRSVAELLSEAAKRHLLDGETPQRKVGGLCRDFALLAVSRFRLGGVPARLCVGFADYLAPGYWEDHWLCEWRDGGRWKRLDVEFAGLEEIPFDAQDVPGERFMTADEAWRRLKDEPGIASQLGVSSLGLAGDWFVAGSLYRQMAALRKLELKPWDYWGLSADLSRHSRSWPQEGHKTFDQLAARLAYAHVAGVGEPRSVTDWSLPKKVVSFPRGEPVEVLIGA
ncbi:transglutaminase domain-containing protein [Rhizobium sp. FKL33]|uniref:transglutaminase domain-containing protein n=1 Tax=Rhizobium sp. FKL33 TaxID=2562307 RepID=UPI0010C0B46A|nr:transglutaminase domain-containing protein [Rhizobium sp. FKL33]